MKIYKIIKVIIALSGGVDSSVTVWILKQLGYKIKCVFIKCWEENNNNNNNIKKCKYKKDYQDAKKICQLLNVKLYKINLSFEYWKYVFSKFIKNQKKNKTLNPDILCNKKIKFKIFIKFSIKILKANFISTGHYIIKKKKKNIYYLIKGIDKKKDQSYFLYNLTQKKIKKCIFPLGTYYKKNIRKIAKNLNFINSKKKDSTGICFIGKKNFFKFIQKYIKSKPGKIINTENKILGNHKGLHLYTIGQRKKLNINLGQHIPYYVFKKNIKNNKLIVVSGIKNKLLYSIGMYIKNIHFINKKNNKKKILFCNIKIRHQQYKKILCKIYLKKKKILSKKKMFAITPGQSVVFYKKNICLGGAIIKKNILFNKKN